MIVDDPDVCVAYSRGSYPTGLSQTELTGAERIWFVMDCGSEIGNASQYNRRLAERKRLRYMGTAQIVMPENYIAMFAVPQAEEARKIVEKAEPTIAEVVARLKNGQAFPPPRSNLYDRFMSAAVNPVFYRFIVKAEAFQASRLLHRLRAMRPQVPDEQHSARKRQTRLGQGMHPLHGLYLLLPGRSHRIWEKEPRQTALSV